MEYHRLPTELLTADRFFEQEEEDGWRTELGGDVLPGFRVRVGDLFI